jgi:hypothetical protein
MKMAGWAEVGRWSGGISTDLRVRGGERRRCRATLLFDRHVIALAHVPVSSSLAATAAA